MLQVASSLSLDEGDDEEGGAAAEELTGELGSQMPALASACAFLDHLGCTLRREKPCALWWSQLRELNRSP